MRPEHPEHVTISREDLLAVLGYAKQAENAHHDMAVLRLTDTAGIVLHQTPAGGSNLHGTYIGDNQDPDCFCIYQDRDDADRDVVHICDWPALKAAIDKHQSERGGRI